MPKRTDIASVLVIGSGPIVIGQACEFDYSGTQACRVLRAEGIRVSLINSNPATIMTDPEFADATYIEPITPEYVEKVIAAERPDAILATLGGQTALNTALALHDRGVLERYGVELIGADVEAIRRGEDRERFKEIVASIGAESARSRTCYTVEECLAAAEVLSYPVVVRPSFTMGGYGGGIAPDAAALHRMATAGLYANEGRAGITASVLIEESVLGWKEYELELMRDRNDNVVVVCSIENLDPMGVHTGDSITVAPAMTLTDREYQHLRDVGIEVLRAVGVDTGGCNIQFAVNPLDGRLIVIEMNPRVSRSSALASKATGFPIAKIAAQLAIGYTLDEISNDITRETPAAFEPTLDYVVVKAPRFAFEKFPGADPLPRIARADARRAARHRPPGGRPGAAAPGRGADRAAAADRLRCAAGRCVRRGAARRDGDRPVVPRPARAGAGRHAGHHPRARRAAPGQAARPVRRPGRRADRRQRRGGARCPARRRDPAGVQDRRHLCGGVRSPDAVPLLDLRRRDRGRAIRPTQGPDPGQRTESHRTGHRVRLRLRARLVRPA
jgi:carbamoylphosphate synthase large subunit